MTEKVIHEMRIIETDDGYRIEIKGDKEQLRAMGFGPFGFAPRRGFGRRWGFGPGRGHRHGHGRQHAHPDVASEPKTNPDAPSHPIDA